MGNKFFTYLLTWYAEAQRVDTLVENVQCLSIGFFGIVSLYFLTNVPCVVIFFVASYKGIFPGQSTGSVKFLYILSTVEGLYVETFCSAPNKALLKISTL